MTDSAFTQPKSWLSVRCRGAATAASRTRGRRVVQARVVRDCRCSTGGRASVAGAGTPRPPKREVTTRWACAGVRMAKTTDGLFYVEDVYRDQLSAHGVDAAILSHADSDGTLPRRVPGPRPVAITPKVEPSRSGRQSSERSPSCSSSRRCGRHRRGAARPTAPTSAAPPPDATRRAGTGRRARRSLRVRRGLPAPSRNRL